MSITKIYLVVLMQLPPQLMRALGSFTALQGYIDAHH